MKTPKLFRQLILATVAIVGALPAKLPAATYSNPVLAGDFPDPSVIRVSDEYWATATTSEWAPIFPLLHSRDLVNWSLVGHVFQKRPDWSVANYWAPEISEYRGRYYIYYVGRKKGGPLSLAVATASKPQGPWTDHGPLIGQDAGSIDAVTEIDEHGERYLIWKEDGNSRKLPTPIWAQKLSDDGTRLVGDMKELMRNDAPWEANLVEGPFIKKQGDYFYMFYSGAGCCGRGCNYALGVARSKKLLGPWEKNPASPILAENEHWKCPGHGSIVTDTQGRDFLLYHAYHPKTFVYVGREGLLDEVMWGADGWPTINQGKGPSHEAPAPLKLTATSHSLGFFDDFKAPASLRPQWQWPHNNEPVVRIDRTGSGHLILSQNPENASDPIGGVLALQTTTGDYAARTRVEFRLLEPGVVAGLSAYGDRENALGVGVGNGKVTVWRRQKNKHEAVASSDAPKSTSLQLRLTARDGHRFRFAFSPDGRKWKNIGADFDLEGNFLPPWDRGVRVALTVGGAEGASAKFDWFRLTPTK